MGDFMADNNERKSIFDSFKFWGHRPKLRDALSADIEKRPTIIIEDMATDNTIEDVATDDTIEDVAIEDTPKEKADESNPSSVSLYNTISGNLIISRGWDGNNMQVYKTRRRN
ncbi:hypothetical protein P5G62_007810 [Neobacillus sp. 179-C4.2 HS]|uniref:Uncharacterized protein n=1 Tax=Neobacillus driksii TaxID=3035913 RepID=A0ABV4YQ73_9BACI|nr:hypothetical protein [Neobacillus sp. 179.-C4.2 HS]MDP5196883.1 hypothetical protein [Neobacillus sp. 179.-C4.2 HS]